MAKREFLMLAQKYDPSKHQVNGWFLSEKLDGMRCIWDGGVTRGMLATSVPWANTAKDARYRNHVYCSGLWSRSGKVIHAPEYFLNSLPPFPLDGELYIGPGQFQRLASTVKSLVPGDGWSNVRLMVFDSPKSNVVFSDGTISTVVFNKRISGCADFLSTHNAYEYDTSHTLSFETTLKWLERQGIENEHVTIHHQEQLPFSTPATKNRIEELLQSVIEAGGEGVMLRRHVSLWLPFRSWDLLKYKPYSDAEGVVTGFVWGRKTDKGSKLLAKVGALVLNYQGKRLELSGFTDAEREVSGPDVQERGSKMAGEYETDPRYSPTAFPRGSKVTFIYRELSDDGIPKEARYHRKHEEL